MSSSPEVRSLIERALADDREAFEQLIRLYTRLVYAQVILLLANHAETEDVLQETFCRAYRFRVRLRDPEKFLPWLLTIARNLARDRLRRRLPQARDEMRETDGALAPELAAGPGTDLDASEFWQEVETALAGLPNHYRTVLTLRYLENLDHRTLQARMGLSNGALRGILVRALQEMRKLLRTRGIR